MYYKWIFFTIFLHFQHFAICPIQVQDFTLLTLEIETIHNFSPFCCCCCCQILHFPHNLQSNQGQILRLVMFVLPKDLSAFIPFCLCNIVDVSAASPFDHEGCQQKLFNFYLQKMSQAQLLPWSNQTHLFCCYFRRKSI